MTAKSEGFIEVSAEDLEKKANELQNSGKALHFHLLTTVCKFNKLKKHTFLLEDSSDKFNFAVYSETANKTLGKKLLNFLHGVDVSKVNGESREFSVPDDFKKIIERAKKITKSGQNWHHHLFLPKCIFNESGKYKIVFEDPQRNTVLEALSYEEPTKILKIIESLYYSQKKIAWYRLGEEWQKPCLSSFAEATDGQERESSPLL